MHPDFNYFFFHIIQLFDASTKTFLIDFKADFPFFFPKLVNVAIFSFTSVHIFAYKCLAAWGKKHLHVKTIVAAPHLLPRHEP